MYDIIIDPNRDGCTILAHGNMTRIKGNLEMVCHELKDRITVTDMTRSKRIQIKSVAIDGMGIGKAYIDFFRFIGVEVTEIKYKPIDELLPKLW